MRYTRSQACAKVAEEAQALLLQLATQPLISDHAVSNSASAISILPSNASLSIPLTLVIVRGSSVTSVSAPLISLETPILLQSSSNSNSTLPIAPSVVSTHLRAVHGLPIAGLKKKQEKYKVALRVQCVTLLNAGIPLDVICSRFFVTKSAVYRWKRIAKA